jgi:hypothetical protein
LLAILPKIGEEAPKSGRDLHKLLEIEQRREVLPTPGEGTGWILVKLSF